MKGRQMRKTVKVNVMVALEVPVVDYLEIQDGTKTEINNQYRNYALGVIRSQLSGLDPSFIRFNLAKEGKNE
jgi:hypothetical protein